MDEHEKFSYLCLSSIIAYAFDIPTRNTIKFSCFIHFKKNDREDMWNFKNKLKYKRREKFIGVVDRLLCKDYNKNGSVSADIEEAK